MRKNLKFAPMELITPLDPIGQISVIICGRILLTSQGHDDDAAVYSCSLIRTNSRISSFFGYGRCFAKKARS
jgi:hypothetical protein